MPDVGGVLTGRDIVCFSEPWGGERGAGAHVMRTLARRNRVLWVEVATGFDLPRAFRSLAGMRERHPNIRVLTPVSLPFGRNDLVRAANAALLEAQVARALRELGFREPISWSFVAGAARVAGTLGESLLVYHCNDGRIAAPPQLERRLLLNADVVLCPSARLCAEKARLNPHAHAVRDGVDLEHFAQALDPRTTVPPDVRSEPGPVIGMWGGIGPWTDLALIRYVADAFSGGTVAIIGRATAELKMLARSRNIRLVGERPYAELPRYARAFDVALVPLRSEEATLLSLPAEIREYIAAGLPVVSTALPEVEQLGLCRIGRSPDEVVGHISDVISEGPGPTPERAAQMQGDGWDGRVAEMEQIIAAALAERRRAA